MGTWLGNFQDQHVSTSQAKGGYASIITIIALTTSYLIGLAVLLFISIQENELHWIALDATELILAQVMLCVIVSIVSVTILIRVGKRMGLHFYFAAINLIVLAFATARPPTIVFLACVPLVTPLVITFLLSPRHAYIYVLFGIGATILLSNNFAFAYTYLLAFLMLNSFSWFYVTVLRQQETHHQEQIRLQAREIEHLQAMFTTADDSWQQQRQINEKFRGLQQYISVATEEETLVRDSVRVLDQIFPNITVYIILLDSTVQEEGIIFANHDHVDNEPWTHLTEINTVLERALQAKVTSTWIPKPGISLKRSSYALPETAFEHAIPLFMNHETYGAIYLQSHTPPMLTRPLENQLDGIAKQLSHQIHAIRRIKILEKNSALLTELQQIIERMNQQATVDSALNVLIQHVGQIFSADESYLYLESEVDGSLEAVQLGNSEMKLDPQEQQVLYQELLVRSFKAASAIISNKIGSPEGHGHPISLMCCPITLRERPLGVILLKRSAPSRPPFDNHERQLSVLLASQAGAIITNYQLMEETQKLVKRERIVSQISAEIRRGLNAETVLQTAARQIGQALDSPTVRIRLHGSGQEVLENNPATEQ